jgi:hypothetical protein
MANFPLNLNSLLNNSWLNPFYPGYSLKNEVPYMAYGSHVAADVTKLTETLQNPLAKIAAKVCAFALLAIGTAGKNAVFFLYNNTVIRTQNMLIVKANKETEKKNLAARSSWKISSYKAVFVLATLATIAVIGYQHRAFLAEKAAPAFNFAQKKYGAILNSNFAKFCSDKLNNITSFAKTTFSHIANSRSVKFCSGKLYNITNFSKTTFSNIRSPGKTTQTLATQQAPIFQNCPKEKKPFCKQHPNSHTFDGDRNYYHSDGSFSHTYDGGRSWYNSDGSFSHTYDGGKSWYHSDGSFSHTYDGGRSWYNSDGSSLHTYDGGRSFYRNDGFNIHTYVGSPLGATPAQTLLQRQMRLIIQFSELQQKSPLLSQIFLQPLSAIF